MAFLLFLVWPEGRGGWGRSVGYSIHWYLGTSDEGTALVVHFEVCMDFLERIVIDWF
jgi:hypothetical protein